MTSIKLVLLYMFLVKAGVAQNPKYPMLSIDNNLDTVVTFSMPQIKALNVQLLNMEECFVASDSTEQELRTARQLIAEQKKVIIEYIDLTMRKEDIIKGDSKIFASKDKIITDYKLLDKQHIGYEKELKAKIISWKIGFTVSIAAGLAVLIFVK